MKTAFLAALVILSAGLGAGRPNWASAAVFQFAVPDTILRWHHQLVAQKWDYSRQRKSVGRPRVEQEVVDLVLQFARENPAWRYDDVVSFNGRRQRLRRSRFSPESHSRSQPLSVLSQPWHLPASTGNRPG